VTSQNLIEFRSVATRPADVNGLGMSLSEVEGAISDLEKAFPLLPDIPAIFRAWKTLVVAAAVLGRQVHDARHVAVCQAYGLSQILTFDDSHFTRLVSFTPPTVVIHPSAI
jgi:predicted nucleic acid-binding protein